MKKFILSALIILFAFVSQAQHEHHIQDTSKKTMRDSMPIKGMMMEHDSDTLPGKNMPMNGMEMNHDESDHMNMNEMSMNHAFSLNLPMSRNGSGTGWLPDASPMYAIMYHSKNWMYMLHGNFFLRYDNQDFSHKGSRGDDQVDAPNWLMFMGQRKVGKNGLFHFSSMLSLDPLTVGNAGYPLLFQSGESYKGKSLVDRQHPHDLFSELSVSYSQAMSKKSDVYLYLGYPGEPALGPVAFMHRPSAMDDPDAPISHHWVDATHITFGVATLGVRYGNFKIEGSSFTGREPDEKRYNFDKPLFNSWSGRLSYNPSANWALQVSHGFIKAPELLHPNEDVNRTTASAIYSIPTKNNGTFNATAVWGMNQSKGQKAENALLVEAAHRKNKLGLYARYEWVQKNIEELVLDEGVYGDDAVFPVNAYTAGFNYDLFRIEKQKLPLEASFLCIIRTAAWIICMDEILWRLKCF